MIILLNELISYDQAYANTIALQNLHKITNFTQNQRKKIKGLSKAESSENQDIKSHTDFQAKTGQRQKNLQQSRASPVESPVLLYRIIHLITEGRVTNILNYLQTIDS